MALSFVKYTGDGVTTQWTVTPAYISKLYIFVLVDDVSVPFVWVNNSLIQTATAAADQSVVEIRRDTKISAPLVDFEDGGTLAEEDLDLEALQGLHLAQEQADDIDRSMNLAFDEKWDAENKPMKNLADPSAPTALTDAINIGTLNTALVGSGNVPIPLDPSEDNFALIAGSGLWSWGQLLVASISDIVADLKTFLTSADLATARTNLGLGTAAVLNDGTGAGDVPLNSDLGTASLKDTGTATGEIPLLDGVGMPVVSGNQMTFDAMINAMNWNKGSNLASGTTTDIGAATGNFVDVTGTTTITGLGTVEAGSLRIVRFTGVLLITHNATSLICLGGANITTAANDIAVFISLGSGNWVMADYVRKSGAALVAGSGFRGALVTDASAQTITTAVLTDMNWDQESYDTDTIHDTSTNNERLSVPSGVTKVRLSYNIQWAPNSTGERQVFIRKNGSDTVYDGRNNQNLDSATAGNTSMNGHTAIITVVGGTDYFAVRVLQTSGGNLDVLEPNGWFAMEIIE